jgi:phosphatidylserine/phosphatidylglycerophosphate/cardiolipin synthase-like enzyme
MKYRFCSSYFIFFSLSLLITGFPVHARFSMPSFGTTHFIVGFPHKPNFASRASSSVFPKRENEPKKVTHKSTRAGEFDARAVPGVAFGEARVLFSPDDDIQKELIALINSEKNYIRIAIYSFTDKEIAQALIDAKKRGVMVELVIDPSNMYVQHSKIPMLEDEGITVFAYNPEHLKPNQYTLMHHKFVIFDCCTPSQVALVWTGSFNFTRSASNKNQENVVILQHDNAIKRFESQFDLLKTRCRNCQREVRTKVAMRGKKESRSKRV